jgi:hypothetical protein
VTNGGQPVSRREVVIVLSLAILVLGPIYAATANWSTLQSNDPRSAALAGWQLATTGSLAMDPDWPADAVSWGAEGRDGRVYSNRFPGVIAVASVAYAAAAGTSHASGSPAHPYLVPLWPATAVAIVIAIAAVVVTHLVFRGLDVPRWVAGTGTAFVALGTPVWSVSADALWTHGLTHLLLLAGLLAMQRGRLYAMGLWWAAAVTVRPHLVVAAVVVAVRQPSWRGRLPLLVLPVAGLLVVAAYSFAVFGQVLPAAGYAVDALGENAPIRSPRGLLSNLAAWLTDPLRGVLIYVPLAALALPGIPAVWRDAPAWVRDAAVAGLAYAFVQLSVIRASGGNFFFGHRTTIEALVLAAPLVLLSIHRLCTRLPLARVAITVIALVSVATHAFGAVVHMPPGARSALERYQERTWDADDT